MALLGARRGGARSRVWVWLQIVPPTQQCYLFVSWNLNGRVPGLNNNTMRVIGCDQPGLFSPMKTISMVCIHGTSLAGNGWGKTCATRQDNRPGLMLNHGASYHRHIAPDLPASVSDCMVCSRWPLLRSPSSRWKWCWQWGGYDITPATNAPRRLCHHIPIAIIRSASYQNQVIVPPQYDWVLIRHYLHISCHGVRPRLYCTGLNPTPSEKLMWLLMQPAERQWVFPIYLAVNIVSSSPCDRWKRLHGRINPYLNAVPGYLQLSAKKIPMA